MSARDGLVVVAQYPWDGRIASTINTTHFMAGAWGRATGQPVMVVNLVPWRFFLRWPRDLWWLRPGLRRKSESGPAILTFVGRDWRACSAAGRAVPAGRVGAAIRRAAVRLGMSRPVLLAADPAHARLFGACGEAATVYFRTDDLAAGDPSRAESIAADDLAAAGRADLLLTVSETLAEPDRRRGRVVHVLPNGVDPDTMRALAALPGPPPGWDDPPRPRVLYVGYLNRRVDFPALADAVRRHADKTFVLLGPVDEADAAAVEAVRGLSTLPNVRLLGQRDRAVVAWVASRCDLGLVPYRSDPFNLACSPLKVFEYASVDLPVIASPLPALAGYGDSVRLAEPAELGPAIDEELARAPERRARLKEFVAKHTWVERARELDRLLSSLPPND